MLTDLIRQFYLEKMDDVDEFLKAVYPFLVVSIVLYGNFLKLSVIAEVCMLRLQRKI